MINISHPNTNRITQNNCSQNNSKGFEWILLKFSGNVTNWQMNSSLNVCDILDSGETLTFDYPKIKIQSGFDHKLVFHIKHV